MSSCGLSRGEGKTNQRQSALGTPNIGGGIKNITLCVCVCVCFRRLYNDVLLVSKNALHFAQTS